MEHTAILNHPAPELDIECWAQGNEPPIGQLTGQVVLVEVIQVNCPGCFVHALPEAIRLHETYSKLGLKVLALATAFEHFEQNTLLNLQHLLETGEVQGDPLRQLDKAGFLEGGRLPYDIPFSVGMDRLIENEAEVSDSDIEAFILDQIPDFHHGSLGDEQKQSVYRQAQAHLSSRRYRALTFDKYRLQGTPSSILVDKKGMLRNVSFGSVNVLEGEIKQLLEE